jgi:hypothetical protein
MHHPCGATLALVEQMFSVLEFEQLLKVFFADSGTRRGCAEQSRSGGALGTRAQR